jgi:hypothetical protein
MIDPFLMFNVSKYFALAGWFLVLVSLFVPKTRRMIWPFTQFVAPGLLCFCYILMVWDGWSYLNLPYSFTELRGIGDLYANFGPLTASWLHFLALDLFAGAWMVRDGVERNMPLLAIFVCLPFTFIFGPAGLLLYILLRYLIGRRGAPDA